MCITRLLTHKKCKSRIVIVNNQYNYKFRKEEETKGSQRKPPQPNLNRAGRGARGGGRGGAHRAENLIQSHSIFEAGPGQSVKRCELIFRSFW